MDKQNLDPRDFFLSNIGPDVLQEVFCCLAINVRKYIFCYSINMILFWINFVKSNVNDSL